MSEQAQSDASAVTVTALATQLSHALNRAFPSVVSVEGELTNFKAYPSGHWYFSLTDGESTLSCTMFKGANRTVRLVARDGLKVRLSVEVNFYPPNGRLQLIARSMAEAGLGDQKARLDALRAKLVAEGLTDPARKRPLPQYPQCIGVITSPKGAVIRDICTVLQHRWPLAEIRLYSAAVQGDDAPTSLIEALRRAYAERQCDVLILGRGGGSQEDLFAFNDEALVRLVASSPIPIVTAVGHETDTGLVDLVSDRRAATPSQAAELVSPDRAERAQYLAAQMTRLAQRAGNQIALAEQRLELLTYRLDDRADRFVTRLSDQLQTLRQRLVSPAQYMALKSRDLFHLASALHASIHRTVEQYRIRLSHAAGALDVLSPLATLGRGYGIVQRVHEAHAHLIGSIEELEANDTVSIRLRDGAFNAEVLSLIKETP